MLQTALGAAAAVLAIAFALSTFERWLDRRPRYDLMWTIALVMFAVASGALAAGAAGGWDGATFRVFYVFGAVTNVPFLGLGTLYLLGADRRRVDAIAVGTAVAVAFAAGVVVAAPFTGPVTGNELPQGSAVFGALPRICAAVASAGGATVVVAGAVLSALRYRRRNRRIVAANLLIAVGTLVTGASGLLNSVIGEMTAFAVTLVAGITLLFAGFLVATTAGAAGSVRSAGDAAPSRSGRGAARVRT